MASGIVVRMGPDTNWFIRAVRHSCQFRRWVGVLWLGAAACLAPVAGAAGRTAGSDDFTLNFVGADIETSVKAISQITGRNFVLDPRVKGTINIVSGRPVSRELAYQVLVSALRLQGYAVVEGRHLTKVLPESEAKVQAGGVGLAGTAAGEHILTQVFHIRHESAPQLLSALKPLVGASQSITANAASNTLIVTDTVDNLRRLERIIASVDVAHGDAPMVIPLRHISAVEAAQNLSRLFSVAAPGAAGGTVVAVADNRGNRLILRADHPGVLAKATHLIAGMDTPDSGLGNIRVIPLRHADAVRMAQMLRAILGGEAGSGGAGGHLPLSGASAATAGSAAQATVTGVPGTFQGTAASAASSTATQAANGLLSGSSIQADTASNSLIVVAPESVFSNLQNVVALLDRRQAQVHIEALIVELTAERAAEFGIQWQDLSGIGKDGLKVVGGTNFGGTGTNIISSAVNIGSVGKGFNFGLVDGQINIPGLGTITNLGLLARFLETEANGNILSTPSITTLNNEEAKIVIGQNLPFVTGSFSTVGNSTSVTPFQTYERRDVGLTLKVRPQITQGGVIRVQIYQEASSVQAGTASSASGPTTNKRSLESSVLVDDGKIIVLGGLIEDSMGNSEEKVPVIGDLPILRNLFRYENRSRKKTNLMVFLRPRIVHDEGGYREIADDRYRRMLEQQTRQRQADARLQESGGIPELPAMDVRADRPLAAEQ